MKKKKKKKKNLHIQSGDEAKAKPFSGPVVLVLKTSHHSFPHVLREKQIRSYFSVTITLLRDHILISLSLNLNQKQSSHQNQLFFKYLNLCFKHNTTFHVGENIE